ncbi:MAG: DUF2285 domain-containing protein [bacterium]
MSEKRGTRRKLTAVQYQTLLVDLRQVKGECLLRIAEYRREAEAMQKRLLRARRRSKRWTEEDLDDGFALSALAQKWGISSANANSLLTHPFGRRMFSTSDIGIVLLSPPSSPLFVVGIDLRADLDGVETWLRKLIQVHRKQRKKEQHESTFRYGPAYVESVREALRAWDLEQDGKTVKEIREALFPGARELSLESNRKKVRERLALARHLIEERGYREILPLQSEQFRFTEEFCRSVGFDR